MVDVGLVIKQLIATVDHCFQDVREQLVELYKGFRKNPQWLLMRYFVRFDTVRSVMLAWAKITSGLPVSYPEENSIFGDLDLNSVVTSLKTDGFYLGLRLPPEIVQEICHFSECTPCYGNRKPKFGFYYADKEQVQYLSRIQFLTGYYFNTAQSCPAIERLARNPTLLAIAAHYFQAEPKHLGNQLWWSFAVEAKPQEQRRAAQFFHYDLDDCLCLKFFFYLTDVDASSGPHVCIRGSHKQKKFIHKLKRRGYTDSEILKNYDQKDLVTICGEAGFGFVEDPACFHKGVTPKKRDRLILQIEFALHDYGMQHDHCNLSKKVLLYADTQNSDHNH